MSEEEVTNVEASVEAPAEETTPVETPAEETTETPTEVKLPVNEEETKEETPKEDPTTKTDEEVSNQLKDKGFDFNKLQDEFEQYGDITEETREQLAKQGITKEILDGYIEGRIAIVQRQMDDIAASIGGRSEFESVVNWAKANLSEEEKVAIDKVHDPAIIKVILKDLKGRMQDADGYVPQQLTGEGGKAPSDLFESIAQMRAAIEDPRYDKDEAYRDKIGKKITASREAGTIRL